MNKFKVGDIVVGNEKANVYGITKQGIIAVVQNVFNNVYIGIRYKGDCFTVLAECFDTIETKDVAKFSIGDLISTHPISLKIKRVIFNDPATIVLWQDGTKTVVKVHDEPFDAEKGLAMAILKKLCGKAQLRKEFKKWIKEEQE